MFNKHPLATAIGSVALASAFAGAGALPQIALAEEAQLEEVVVTGSRIRRADYVANAPVATLGADQIELTATVNTEQLLNTMPQMVPGFDRTSNNPGNGTATVDLRGLGSNRTLVLINGTRAVPTTQGGSVDINNIPTALIERVEVLTGGASAVYGSDAVAGVVNFVLKDDFEGVSFNVMTEQTEEGDAELTSVDLTIGGNIADGRGNVVINAQYTDRSDLFQGDRGFANFAQFDDTDANGNPILINGGSSGVPGTSIFAGGLGGFSPDSSGIVFGDNGAARPFVTGGDDNDFYNYAPVNYIQLPQTRFQANALGHFDVSDKIQVYGRMMFTQSKVPQQLAPTPIFQAGAEFTLDGSPFLPAATQQVLSDALGSGVDSDGDGIDDTATAFVRRRLVEVGPRISDDKYTNFQLLAGVRGDIGETGWTYDVYVSEGEVSNSNTQSGNVNRDRFLQALLLDLNADPTGGTCVDTANNGSTVGCAPMNIFGPGNISDDAAAFLRTAVAAEGEFEQRVWAASFAGDLFNLPAGAVAAAFGFERIELRSDFRPSQDLAAGTIAGFNGSPASGGAFDSDAFFGELLVPVVRDLPMAEAIDLELAYRTTDYSTVGSVDNYKIAGSWTIVPQVRVRGGFNTAIRAASIGELFAPQSEGFPGASDPCAGESAPVDAATAAICTATGVPAGAVGSVAIDPAAGQIRGLFGGNPNLSEEEADTITVGVVIEPDWFVEDLTVSIDYFDIKIDGAIASFGGGVNNILNVCYDATNAAGGVGSPFCNAVNRRADGTIEFVEATSQNIAEVTLKGFDLQASYSRDLFGGDMQVNYVGTYTTESTTVPFAGGDPIECEGQFGLDCGEPLPEYKHRMTFNWSKDKITSQLLWRYVGEVKDDDVDTTYFIETIDGTHYFDGVVSYAVTDNYRVSLGVDNLFDEKPPILGDNQEQANTYPATYDVFGRTYFLRASANF
ncbi:MAG: TonB-dependent receptor [Pseudomonadota bacterium]|nr:TonB-dependent receptor [Pseudomonadota bacterium]